jgi:cobalt-zinc-cadmium efflux system outer membrane protein
MSTLCKGTLAALALTAIAAGAEATPCDGYTDGASTISPGEPLTLSTALAEIRRVSPSVRAAALEARALDAEADQAGRRLNPSLSLELENFSGSGPLSGFDQTETTFALEQTFRLGGKRSLSERAARARQAAASAECAVILRETELEAAILFAELVAAAQLRDLAEDSADLADELTNTVELRVDAGAAAPPELARAIADAAALRASVASAQANIDRRRYALALLWGSAEPTFAIPAQISVDPADLAGTSVIAHPALDRADASVSARSAEQKLARSAAIPDVTVSAGFRRFEETGDEALIAGVSVPLPLFDRGRDTARASAFRGEVASLNRAATQQQLLARQRAAISARRAAQTRLDITRETALPAAEAAYEAAVSGYQIGRFDLTTTLNARTALLDARLAVIDAELALQSEDLRLRALISAAPFNGESK